jgi:hypothetical protein
VKQPRCPATDKQIKKIWYIYIYNEFYSNIRKNEAMWFESKWIQLENVRLSEVSQAQKDKGCMFSLICNTNTSNIMKNRSC